MKRLLIISALALTSCAPLLSSIQGDSAALTRDKASVLFSAGTLDAEDVAVYINGSEVTATGDGAQCKVISTGIGCALGTVPAGRSFRLIITGNVTSGSATFYRPMSNRPVLTTLKGE